MDVSGQVQEETELHRTVAVGMTRDTHKNLIVALDSQADSPPHQKNHLSFCPLPPGPLCQRVT